MRTIIREIRKQPIHIRHLFMWPSVAIAFSLVVFIGIQSAKSQFTALLNPGQEAPSTQVAEKETASPFGAIINSAGSFQANISEFFKGKPAAQEKTQYTPSPVPPQMLPVN